MNIVLRLSIIIFLYSSFGFSAMPPELPIIPAGLLYFPCDYAKWGAGFQVFSNSIMAILNAHDYHVDAILGGEVGDPLNPDVGAFVYFFNLSRGYITIFTHGKAGWLALEYYLTYTEADNRKQELENIYGTGFFNVFQDPSHDPPYYYMVCVNPTFIQQQIVNPLPGSIIFVDACKSASGSPSILQAFLNVGAHCGFGWSTLGVGSEIFAPIDIFYRMGGSNFAGYPGIPPVIQYELYNKTAATARSEYGNSDLALSGNGGMVLYNAPRIVGLEVIQSGSIIYRYGFSEDGEPPEYPYRWEYPGDLSGCPKNPAIIGAQPLQVRILFSAPMRPDNIQVLIAGKTGNFAIPVNGTWGNLIFDNQIWTGVCDFSEWRGGDTAVVKVTAEDGFTGDLYLYLDTDGDGASDGTDTNHKFKVELPPQVIFTDPSDGAGEGMCIKISLLP